MRVPLHLHMPLSIQGPPPRPKEEKDGGKEGEPLPGLTTRWPSESDGVKGSEGGEADKEEERVGKGQAFMVRRWGSYL